MNCDAGENLEEKKFHIRFCRAKCYLLSAAALAPPPCTSRRASLRRLDVCGARAAWRRAASGRTSTGGPRRRRSSSDEACPGSALQAWDGRAWRQVSGIYGRTKQTNKLTTNDPGRPIQLEHDSRTTFSDQHRFIDFQRELKKLNSEASRTVTRRDVDVDLDPNQLLQRLRHIKDGEAKSRLFEKVAWVHFSLKLSWANVPIRWSTHRFQTLQSRDVQEGDGSEVQDQAVDVHPRNDDVGGKLGAPVDAGVNVVVTDVVGETAGQFECFILKDLETLELVLVREIQAGM